MQSLYVMACVKDGFRWLQVILDPAVPSPKLRGTSVDCSDVACGCLIPFTQQAKLAGMHTHAFENARNHASAGRMAAD